MTVIYFNNQKIYETTFLLPAFKWIAVARKLNLELLNYGTEVYFNGENSKGDAL